MDTTVEMPCVLLFLSCLCVMAHGSSWMEQPYQDDSFNMKQDYLSNVTLQCDDGVVPVPFTVQYWVLPNLQHMMPGDRQEFRTLDGMAGWQVSSNGSEMYVTLIQEFQFGFYHCVVEANDTLYTTKKALNYKGPYFGDLWAKYEKSVIISCSAAGGFLVLVLSLCFLHSYKYPDVVEPVDDVTMAKLNGSHGNVNAQYDNPTSSGIENKGYDDQETRKEGPSAVQVVSGNGMQESVQGAEITAADSEGQKTTTF